MFWYVQNSFRSFQTVCVAFRFWDILECFFLDILGHFAMFDILRNFGCFLSLMFLRFCACFWIFQMFFCFVLGSFKFLIVLIFLNYKEFFFVLIVLFYSLYILFFFVHFVFLVLFLPFLLLFLLFYFCTFLLYFFYFCTFVLLYFLHFCTFVLLSGLVWSGLVQFGVVCSDVVYRLK